ncbi:hypothetical protein E2562_008841 [Oryza meyeriana var. granulata]|uniref:TOG domain-containing protein n=1 Tax=Oryza meyeriana var. granulata TaxID=110450 RepID=A0A6G1D074_9ORYZ|nr:hypothetical protein E2562_008841 [Oryza meyeriana var. granulata]
MKSSAVTSKGKAVFELKHRLVQAINKIADRDTYQIGLDELEKAADTLAPDMVGPFLSCVVDTDAEQKSAVRKECIKVIGTLARSHGSLVAPHMTKMVASIVKRLKDADSVVRDACVDTCGTLAFCARDYGDGGSALVALVRPLFESLGEQNSNTIVRIIVLLVIFIFWAEGASTEQSLASALTSIMDALKSSDWTTRKAASLALSSIAVSSGYLVASFRTSCLRSLERCKFDKVKPVRDAITQAIQLWKAIPGSNTPEPSEAGSSTKENFFGDHHDTRSIHDGGSRDTSFRRVDHVSSVSAISGSSITSSKKRSPLSINKIALNNAANQQRSKSSDWHVEISVPKQNMMPLVDFEEKVSGNICMLKDSKRSPYEIVDDESKYEYDPMDDKQDCSSVSEVASRSCETKHVTSAQECVEDCDSARVTEQFPRAQKSKSIDSTVTDITSDGSHSCCLSAMKELAHIRKQLQEMERRQANIFDMLQEFMSNSVENMSVLSMKVHNLENAVDKTVYTITQSESRYHLPGSKFIKNQSATSSPRVSTSTPRSSVDANYKPPPIPHLKQEKKWMHDQPSKGLSMGVKEGEFLKSHTHDKTRKHGVLRSESTLGRYVPSSARTRASGVKGSFPVSLTDSCEQPELQNTLSACKEVGEFHGTDDMESAYVEALNSGDCGYLIDLMDRTGPVLEQLSRETTNELLRLIAGQFLNKKCVDLALPWLQQVADLSMIYKPNQLFMSVRAQKEFLSLLEEAATSASTEPAIRIAIAQLAFKLTKVCEVAPCRKVSTRVCRGNEAIMATAM